MTNDPADLVGQQLIAFLPNLRRFALSLCRSPSLADDLVQAACERALGHANSFQIGTRFDAWMFRIVRNLWIDHLRHGRTAGPQKDITELQDTLASPDGNPVEARLLLGEVWQAINLLPVDQREVMILVCVEEFSYREAAETLEIPIGTVMSRLARARANIAKAIGISGDDVRSSSSRGNEQ